MIAERSCFLSGSDAHCEEKRKAILGATIIIAISHATAADLRSFYPQVSNRIRVIQLGADHLSSSSRADAGLRREASEPFALFVGLRTGYKNFATVLDAMQRSAWPSRVKLRVVGQYLTDQERRLIDVFGLRDRIEALGPVSDAELRVHYESARCFLFPSLVEGFGLPVLEAQANGCPVVISDISVFHEVGGDAALYFDPRLGERLAESVASACEPDVRNQLVESGFANVRRFSWDRTAEETFLAYEEAAAQSKKLTSIP